MSEYGVQTETGAVRLERVLPGPIERVWAYLTESDKRRQWLASGSMDLRVGGAVELHFNHAELSAKKEPTPERYKKYEGGHTNHGTVTRCEPPRLLSFIWGTTPDDDSEVTFELSPQGTNVLLVVTHRRLRDRAGKVSVAGGWHVHLDVLIDILTGNAPRPFWSALAVVDDEYEKRFPAE